MKDLILALAISFSVFSAKSYAQCEADYTVILNNFEFVPSELTIAPGETVAFINIEGEHTVNGISNSITGESFNNAIDYFLEQTTGNSEGVCMGVIEFDTAGIFNFDCSVGYNAEAGMSLNINVDAFDLYDLLSTVYNADNPNPQDVFSSFYAFNSFTNEYLTQGGPWTIFVPNDDAVNEILEYMNLNQFDALNIPDFTEILQYHIAPGRLLAEDLFNGLQIPSAQGQMLNITENNGSFFVNNAEIVTTDLEAYNGVVHVIDYCLAPSGLPEATVMEIIAKSEVHQTFEEAIILVSYDDNLSTQASIDNSIEGPGPFTVYAPTDDAFAFFAQELDMTVDELLESQYIYDLVFSHIFENEIPSSEMYSGNTAFNVDGISVEFDYTDSTFFVIGDENTAEVTITDLMAYNGIVHVIDAVIRPNIPVLEGSCGIWRLNLLSNNDGWEGDILYLYINDEFIEDLTIYEGSNSRNFNFGVDEGDIVDLFVGNDGSGYGGYNHSYKLYNGDGQLVTSINDSPNYKLPNITNIVACEVFGEDHCGKIKIELFHDIGYGWYGPLQVYINGELEQSIDMPVGYKQITEINANYNDTFDFIVNNPVYPEETGYKVFDTNGQVIINDNIINVAPEDAFDIPFCTTIAESWNCINDACIDPMDGSGAFSSLNDCQFTCEGIISSIKENSLDVSIYPNPSSNVFNINLNGYDKYELSVTNIIGEKIYTEELSLNGNYVNQIDLSNFHKGIYNLTVSSRIGASNYKLILQ
ncbi:MAG: fasciclin domain-containing protein [Flavobacteriales bacterium]|nr:fasciclin domain-containing protein [Flavobacteriales bacterium]